MHTLRSYLDPTFLEMLLYPFHVFLACFHLRAGQHLVTNIFRCGNRGKPGINGKLTALLLTAAYQNACTSAR